MNAEEALTRLGASTQEAIAGVLGMFVSEVGIGAVTVTPSGTSPLADVAFPIVATSVSYIDGVSGGNVFLMTRTGARKLAASMMGASLEGIEDDDLSELELSAVSEAMNQMMSAAAAATSSVVDTEVEIAPPQTAHLHRAEDARTFVEESPHSTVAEVTLLGEPCQFIQLVPTTFVMRMTRALEDLEGAEAVTVLAEARPKVAPANGDVIRRVAVTLSVELGRAHMPVGRAVRLWRGAVVELEQSTDAPLEILANGHPFGEGRLVLTPEGDWALRIDRVFAAPDVPEIPIEEGVM